MGVGAVIKRLGYLARRMGVYYDLEYEQVQGTLSRDVSALLALTLYGPQEVTGAPQQYGLRLARLCRVLLGYGVPKGEPGEQERKGSRVVRQMKRTFSRAIVEAEATVHFLQRTSSFVMDADLLVLLPPVSVANPQSERDTAGASTLFDSGVEQNFSEAFSALAESKGVDGWQMEREPEPLLVESGIMIPDFAFTRGRRRIYVEILGFWTPSYRERKVQKLQQLRGRDDILLAIPLEAKDAFAAIANDFPIVYYDEQLSMSDVLQMLRGRYDDFAERLAKIDREAVRQRVKSAGLLPEPLCADVLGCYRRSELARAAERVVDDETIFMAGIGLLARSWLELWRQAGEAWIDRGAESARSVLLDDMLQAVREQWAVLIGCDDAAVEALVSLWPGVSIRRESIFEAVVEFAGEQREREDEAGKNEKAEDGAAGEKETRKLGRRTAAKKRVSVVRETVQGDLWG